MARTKPDEIISIQKPPEEGGEIVGIRKSDYPAALKLGWRSPNPEAEKKAYAEREYEGLGGIAKAFALGGASGAIPFVELAAPETFSEAATGSPFAYRLGQGAGFLAGLNPFNIAGKAAATIGTKLAGEAGEVLAKKAASSIAAKTLGAAISPAALTKTLEAGGEAVASKLGGKLAARALAQAGAGAVGGAVLGAQDAAVRAIVDRPELGAEYLASEAMGGLKSGAIVGGALGAVSAVATSPAVMKAALPVTAAGYGIYRMPEYERGLNLSTAVTAAEYGTAGILATRAPGWLTGAARNTLQKVNDYVWKRRAATTEEAAGLLEATQGLLTKEGHAARIKIAGEEKAQLDALASELTDNLNTVKQTIADIRRPLFGKAQARESRALLEQAYTSPQIRETLTQKARTTTSQTLDGIGRKLQGTIRDAQITAPTLKKISKKVKAFSEEIAGENATATASDIYSELLNLRRVIDKKARFRGQWDVLSPERQVEITALRDVRKNLKSLLENSEVFPGAAERMVEFNKAYANFISINDRISEAQFSTKDAFNKKVFDPNKVRNYLKSLSDPIKGSVKKEILNTWLDSIDDVAEQAAITGQYFPKAKIGAAMEATKAAKTSAVQKLAAKEASELEKSQAIKFGQAEIPEPPGKASMLKPIVDFFATTERTAAAETARKLEQTAWGMKKTLEGLGDFFTAAAQTTTKKTLKGIRRISPVISQPLREFDKQETQREIEQINAVGQDPQALLDHVQRRVDAVDAHDPARAALMAKTLMTGVAFLYDKAPKRPLSDTSLNPFVKSWNPSETSLRQFALYSRAVGNPQVLWQDAITGHVAPETVEAVSAVYPSMYEHMATELRLRLADVPYELPYSKRVLLSRLLKQPLDDSMRPQQFASIQQTYAVTQAAQEQKQAAGRRIAQQNTGIAHDNSTREQRIREFA